MVSHMNTLKRAILALAVLVTGVAVLGGTATATNNKVTICHAAGKAGTTKYVTLTISENAVYGRNGNAGHFSENGTPAAGHEDDYFGACESDTPETPKYDPEVTVVEGICAVGDTTITVTTTTRTFHAEDVDGQFVKVEDEDSPEVVVSTRPLNDAEAVACASAETTTTLPGDTTTTVAVIVGTPPVPPATPQVVADLPHTGNSSGGILMFAAILSIMGAGATALARRKSTII